MKRISTISLIAIAFNFLFFTNVNAQIVAWNFYGTPSGANNNNTPSATSIDANLESTTLNRGSGLEAGGGLSNAYFSAFTVDVADKAASISTGSFYTFTIKAKSNYIVSLTALTSRIRRNGNGPQKVQWQYSISGVNGGNYADLTGVIDLGAGTNGEILGPFNLSEIAEMQQALSSKTITFRLLGWAGVDGGGFAIGREDANNIVLTGLVQHESVLPVKLTSFTAKPSKSVVQLNWTTAAEQNNSHFEILRSANGAPNVVIGRVGGNGTTSTENRYNFTDYSPLANAYYQLRQVDYNGDAQKSEVVFVSVSLNQNTLVAGVGNGKLAVSYQSDVATSANLSVIDLNGKVIVKKSVLLEKGVNQIEVPISLIKGLYVAKLTENGGKTQSTKFVAQ